MKLLNLKKLFKIKTFTKELKISSVFMEAISSVIAGFVLLFFGIIFFSNSTFQYSLFTKARNIFISENKKKEMISGIYTFGIDYEAVLKSEDINNTNYDMLGESIKIISNYAIDNPHKRIIIGLDIIMLTGLNENSKNNLIKILADSPDNLYIVFGGALFYNSMKISFLRIDYLAKNIIEPVIDKNKLKANRFFVGTVHYIKSSVKSGLDKDQFEKIALGYTPSYQIGINNQSYIFSLPILMYIIGNIEDEKDFINFSPDFASGQIFCNDDMQKKIKSKTGLIFNKLKKPFRYNFFYSSDADSLNYNSLTLSNFSSKYSFKNKDKTINDQFNFLRLLNKGKMINKDKTEYFFVYSSNLPDYIKNSKENDTIITPASSKNSFTYEYEKIHGVMTHLTALSNLKNSYIIRDINPVINLTAIIIVSIFIFIISWNQNFNRSLIVFLIMFFSYSLLSFILFLNGFFLPLKMMISISSLIFALTVLLRFFYTTKKINLNQIVSQNILSPVLLKLIEENSESYLKPSVKKDSIILILFLKDLPPIGDTKNSILSYEMLYEKYINLIFNIIEKHNGSHDILYTDGILGFWNVIDNDKNNFINAYQCAKKCIENAETLQKFIDENSFSKKTDYKVYFDICIHKCDVFAGIVGPNNKKDFAISSSEITFAINTARSQTLDKKNSIILTNEFYQTVKKEINKDKINIFNYNGRKLFKIKL